MTDIKMSSFVGAISGFIAVALGFLMGYILLRFELDVAIILVALVIIVPLGGALFANRY